MSDDESKTTVPYGFVTEKHFDLKNSVYVIRGKYHIDKTIRERLTPELRLTQLYYAESGGSPYGIIGSWTQVFVHDIINEWTKTKISITAEHLLAGVECINSNINIIMSQHMMWQQAADTLDGLFKYMMDFPDTGVRPPPSIREQLASGYQAPEHLPSTGPNGSILYRGRVILAERRKTGVFSAQDVFRCGSLEALGPGLTKITALIDKEIDG